MAPIKFRIYTDEAGETRWSAIAPNGLIRADGSEGYETPEGAESMLMDFINELVAGNYEIVREG